VEEKKGRNISVWLSSHDLQTMQELAETRGDTISGLLRAAAQRLETAGASASPVDLTPILQALQAQEERLAARLTEVAEAAGRTAQRATVEALKQGQAIAQQGGGPRHA